MLDAAFECQIVRFAHYDVDVAGIVVDQRLAQRRAIGLSEVMGMIGTELKIISPVETEVLGPEVDRLATLHTNARTDTELLEVWLKSHRDGSAHTVRVYRRVGERFLGELAAAGSGLRKTTVEDVQAALEAMRVAAIATRLLASLADAPPTTTRRSRSSRQRSAMRISRQHRSTPTPDQAAQAAVTAAAEQAASERARGGCKELCRQREGEERLARPPHSCHALVAAVATPNARPLALTTDVVPPPRGWLGCLPMSVRFERAALPRQFRSDVRKDP